MSSKPRILIISSLYEPNVDRAIPYFDAANIPWFRLNTETFPLILRGTWSISADAQGAGLRTFENVDVDLSEVRAVWFRRSPFPALPESAPLTVQRFITGESLSFLNGMLGSLHARWINDKNAEQIATNKLHQLKIARSLGFLIPRTLVTNCPDQARHFVLQAPGRVLYKPVSGYSSASDKHSPAIARYFAEKVSIELATDSDPDATVVFARVVDDYVLNHLHLVTIAPVIFQDYIEKASELRITYVCGEIFACEIYSQENADTRIDFRRMSVSKQGFPPHEAVELPSYFHAQICSLMRTMRLEFGCLDVIRMPEGQLVFLEVNPSGQWQWIEQLTGQPITETLARKLIGACQT